MTQRVFQPGFRIDTKDVVVLVLGGCGVVLLAGIDPFLAVIVGFAVGHFFLFCNVFRLGRPLELIWASVFVALAGSTLSTGLPGPEFTVGITLATTLAVIAAQLRQPSYHGLGWQRINPGLPEWWKARHTAPDEQPNAPADTIKGATEK